MSVQSKTRKGRINNLKLDVDSGAIPERIYVRSKRDEEGDDAVLPTIDINQSPFDFPDDDEDGEIGETSPEEPTQMDEPPLREMPQVETVNDDDPISQRRKSTESGLPPEQMLERTVLMPPAENGTRVRDKNLEKEVLKYYKEKVQLHPDMINFRCRVNDEYEEIVAYTDIVDYIEQDQTWDGTWKFRKILDHQSPIISS
ncbi:hypothetical protein SEMRO_957_G224510.1 [Seminavis robusta]|uniref:Uncharacterized protein n=1 Tax=Seminavis robusta TaxID=568900 RepID=A0A9N8EC58_9STRA|nr:hypothetical protein SEMRO_957_G224510.1 [Seminavis robusta]|eukprot:Sro957_g224510.1 n/a (200) ;mRNA; f:1564-2270